MEIFDRCNIFFINSDTRLKSDSCCICEKKKDRSIDLKTFSIISNETRSYATIYDNLIYKVGQRERAFERSRSNRISKVCGKRDNFRTRSASNNDPTSDVSSGSRRVVLNRRSPIVEGQEKMRNRMRGAIMRGATTAFSSNNVRGAVLEEREIPDEK